MGIAATLTTERHSPHHLIASRNEQPEMYAFADLRKFYVRTSQKDWVRKIASPLSAYICGRSANLAILRIGDLRTAYIVKNQTPIPVPLPTSSLPYSLDLTTPKHIVEERAVAFCKRVCGKEEKIFKKVVEKG